MHRTYFFSYATYLPNQIFLLSLFKYTYYFNAEEDNCCLNTPTQ